MQNLRILSRGINTSLLQLQLRQHPELWNANTKRTENPTSPHREVSDIWVRYNEEQSTSGEPHESVWLPGHELIPAIQEHVFATMSAVRGERLGGILITRIPPGGRVYPHRDLGWHAEYYDKFALQIEAHEQQAFFFEEGGEITLPGDLYWFRNQENHWVVNDSPVDRVTLIMCIRTNRFGHRA